MVRQKKSDNIHVILTGGTIDSYFEATKDTAVPYKHSVIPDYLKSLKLYKKFQFTEICMKDSRAITRSDLKKVLSVIEKSPATKIVVTHGTYTMPDSARYLSHNLKRKDQAIILVASMIPLLGFATTDGPFNLGYAIAKVEVAPPRCLCVCQREDVCTGRNRKRY